MLRISKSKLKANLLELFRRIESTGEEIVVTHHSKPVAIIRPIREQKPVGEIFGHWRGKVVFHEDPNEPTEEFWELD